MTLESAKKNLEARGFRVQVFSSGKEAAAYLDAAVDGTAVGFGGSITLQELGLREMLAAHNEVFWHWTDGPEAQTSAARAPVYITSANALAETAIGRLPRCTATKSYTLWWGATSWHQLMRRRCGGREISPPRKTPSGWAVRRPVP